MTRRVLLSICIAALVVRLAAVATLHNFYHPALYEWGTITHNLLQGNGYCYYEVDGQPMPSAFMPPGYAIFLVMVFRVFGEQTTTSYVVIQALNVIAGVLLVALTYRLARIYWSQQTALLASLFAALYPPFVYMATEVANINFYLVLNLAAVLLISIYLEESRRWIHLTGAGALLGLLVMFRAETIALIPILYALILLKLRAHRRHVAIFAALALLMLAPWIARNYSVFHRFIPTTTAMPIVLWYGHNSQANGTQRTGWGSSSSVMQPSPTMQAEMAHVPAGPDYEIRIHQIYLRQALQFLLHHPRAEFRLFGEKAFYYWTFDMHHPKAAHPAYWIPALVLVILFGTGVICQAGQLCNRYWLFTSYILFSMILALIFHVLPRYRMLVEPLMIPFAAHGALCLYARLRGASRLTGSVPEAHLSPSR